MKKKKTHLLWSQRGALIFRVTPILVYHKFAGKQSSRNDARGRIVGSQQYFWKMRLDRNFDLVVV